MADMKNLKALAIHAAKGTAPTNFSSENVNDAFREELGKVCSDYITFMKNRYDLYDLMITTIDEVVPAISICLDIKRKWIITKSGNLGNSNTLIEILRYLEHHE